MPTYTKQQEFVLSENGGGTVPNATVTVYLFGTSTKASLFTDSTASQPMSNPVQADSTGFYWFYGDNSLHYTFVFTGFGMTPRTLTDVLLPGGGGTSGVGPAGPPGPAGQAIISWGVVPATHDAAGIQEAIYDAFDQGQMGIGFPVVILEPGVIYDMGNTMVEVKSRTGSLSHSVDLNTIVPAHFGAGNNVVGGLWIWCPGSCMFDCSQQDGTHPALDFVAPLSRNNSRIQGINFRGSLATGWGTRTWGMCEIRNCNYSGMLIGHRWATDGPSLFTEQSIMWDCQFTQCQSPVQYWNNPLALQSSFRGTGFMGKNIFGNVNTSTNALITILNNTVVYMAPLDIDVSAVGGGRAFIIDNRSTNTATNFYGTIHGENELIRPLYVGRPPNDVNATVGDHSGTEFFFSGNLGSNRGFLKLGSARLARHVYTFSNFFHSALHEEKTYNDPGQLNGSGQMRVAISGSSMVHVQIKTGNYDCRYRLNVTHVNGLQGPNGEVSPNNNNGSVSVEAVELEIDDGGYGTFLTGDTTFEIDHDGSTHGGFVSLLITNTNLIDRGTWCWVKVSQLAESDRDTGAGGVSPQGGQGIDLQHATSWATTADGSLLWVDATHFQVTWTGTGLVLGWRHVFEFYNNRLITLYDKPAGTYRAQNAKVDLVSDPVSGVTRIVSVVAPDGTPLTMDSSLYQVTVYGD